MGDFTFMQLLHMFWSTQKALGEDFKETWVRVNPNSTIPFISNITNKENEENKDGNSDIGMFEVQVCDVRTLRKLLLTRWWHVNTCVPQVIGYFNPWEKKLRY